MKYWKMFWFVHNFLQNEQMVPKVNTFSGSYFDFRDFDFRTIFMLQTVL